MKWQQSLQNVTLKLYLLTERQLGNVNKFTVSIFAQMKSRKEGFYETS